MEVSIFEQLSIIQQKIALVSHMFKAKRIAILTLILLFIGINQTSIAATYLSKDDIKRLPFTPAPYQFHYGHHPQHIGELRLPEGPGPHPVIIVIHGGCWLSSIATLDFMSPFADALTKLGYATWNIEYRCVDDHGGGWPGTFQDVAAAVDYVFTLAAQFNLDLNRVIVIGHSAGGHLALWSAGRHRLNPNSIAYSAHPLPIQGVVNLAGPGDLAGFMHAMRGILPCATDEIIPKLLGDIQQTSPFEMLPLHVRQILICGEQDHVEFMRSMQKYTQAAILAGDDVNLIWVPNAAHFEVVSPHSQAWPTIVAAVESFSNTH